MDADHAPRSIDSDRKGPLQGVRVLDLSRLVAGNVLTVLLADFGADVIKVEHPVRGDDLRHWTEDGVATWWKVYGRNKRSLALDLKDPLSLDRLKRLTGRSDVFVENFVPGHLEKLGLGPETLFEINPRLVLARVSGWGQTGPYSDRPGFGTLVEAMSGFAHLNGFPDKPPALPPLAMADMYAGLHGAMGVLAALRNVELGDGRGQVVDVSLFESLFSTLASEALKVRVTGRGSVRSGNQAANTAPRNVYVCSDGKYLALSGSVQSMFERLARAVGRPELIDDPRFATNEARVRSRDALDQILGDYFGRRTLSENLDEMQGAGVTVAPVLSVADLVGHPYVEGRGILREATDADLGTCPMPAPVPRLSRTPGGLSRMAPKLGEHTAEILRELEEER